jgi:hypothetical protein
VSKNRVVPLGLLLGAILLGLVAVFAIAIPKLHGDGDIALPDTLPGGFTATDVPSAYKNVPSAAKSQVATYIKGEKKSAEFSDKALKDAYGSGQTRTYVNLTPKSQSSIVVTAFHSDGGAFAPLAITDPSTAAQQGGGDVLVSADDVVCIQHLAASQTGATQTAYFECQKSQNGLTVQVTSQATSLSGAVKTTNTVYKAVS